MNRQDLQRALQLAQQEITELRAERDFWRLKAYRNQEEDENEDN